MNLRPPQSEPEPELHSQDTFLGGGSLIHLQRIQSMYSYPYQQGRLIICYSSSLTITPHERSESISFKKDNMK